MQLTADQLVPLIEGAVGIRTVGGMVQPIRLPVDDLELHHRQLRDPFTGEAAGGVRLRLGTASTTLELDVAHEFSTWGIRMPAVYEVVIDREPVARAIADNGVVAFRRLPRGDKVLEVWLPQGMGVLLRCLHVEEGTHIEQVPDASPRWVVYGSSITHGALVPGTAEPGPTGTWPSVAARRLGWHLTSLGFDASCHLDPYVAHAIAALPADLITLKVGVNVHNLQSLRDRTFAPVVHGFVQTIRDAQPETPITIISPLISPTREESPVSITALAPEPLVGDLSLTQMHAILAEIVEIRRRHGDAFLDYLDGRALLGEADAHHLPDGLHPDAAGLTLIGERFAARFSAAARS